MNLYSFMVLKAPIVTINNSNFIITSYFSSGTPFFIRIPLAFAEEVITILLGAQAHNRPRFLDITFYPIETGKKATWFNADDISHRLNVNATSEESNATILVADSGIISQRIPIPTHLKKRERTFFLLPLIPG
jgi:hypothetical protein